MKAWITIYAMVFAAGLATVLAQETKTNALAGATTSAPANPGEVAVPPTVITTSTPPAWVAKEAKPSATVPSAQPGAVPAQPNILASPKNSGNAHKTAPANPPSATSISTPAPAVASEGPPTGEPLTPTNAVPAEPEVAIATPTNAIPVPSESPGIGNKGALAIGAAILVVAGGVAASMLRHFRIAPHGSLITSAMAVSKNDEKDEDQQEEEREEKKPEKKEEKKFPPPMT